jgi:hypothetical protein
MTSPGWDKIGMGGLEIKIKPACQPKTESRLCHEKIEEDAIELG